jgi:hypothetical protein
MAQITLSRRASVLLLGALGLLLAPLTGSADVTFRTQTTDSLRPSALVRGTIWADATSMRMEFATRDAPGQTSVLIFRADRSLYWTIDPATRSYMEIDRAGLQQLGERVKQTRAEMRARLESLPPEQRKQVEAMLGDMLSMETSTASEEKLVPTDVREQIDGTDTRRFDLALQTEVVGAVWVAEWSALGLAESDLAVFSKLAEFQRDMMQSLSGAAGTGFGSEPLEIFDRVPGFPVRIRRIQDGRTVSETRFLELRRVAPEPGRFEVPAGYTQRAGPGIPDQPPMPTPTPAPIPAPILR